MRKITMILAVFVLGAVSAGAAVVGYQRFGVSHSGGAAAQLATGAPAIPGAPAAGGQTVPVKAGSGGPQGATGKAPADVPGNSHFASDPTQSTAKILAFETGILGDSTLAANGTNVTGDLFLTPDGQLSNDGASGFQLDMRTLHSSDSNFNSFLTGPMDPTHFPQSQFVVQSVSGIPATWTDGNQFNFTMAGQLTMHGVTKPVTWTALGRQSGTFLTFVADTDVLLSDYNLTAPDYGVARAKNNVHLQVSVISNRVNADGTPAAPAAGQSAASQTPPVITTDGSTAGAPAATTASSTSGTPNIGDLGSLLNGSGSGSTPNIGDLGSLLNGSGSGGTPNIGDLGSLLNGSGNGGTNLGSLLNGAGSGTSGRGHSRGN